MTKITIIPKTDQDIFKLMITKEKEGKFGTFYRTGKKKKGEDKWLHTRHPGNIRFHQCYGGICVAILSPEDDWQILQAFIGLMTRQMKESIASIAIAYE
ncbi:MAG TPA: hypothetical protein VM658_14975 [bacterium]|nr:hypothetical protein [bacterium]